MSANIIWLRAETKAHERRTPLTPNDAAELLRNKHQVIVERSVDRIFLDDEYLNVGCELVEPGAWVKAPLNAYILGIKDLPSSNEPLRHKHIYFAHAYKNQEGAKQILNRFRDGDGLLYDLEFLREETNTHRVTTFSYWAGVAGCAVTLLLWIQKCKNDTADFTIPEFYPNELQLIEFLQHELNQLPTPSSLVIGAAGRCGRGVIYLLEKLNLPNTPWDKDDTAEILNYPIIFQHQLLFNCIYLSEKIVPFITKETLATDGKLSIIADISCDPNGPNNPLPIYDRITTFQQPTLRVLEQPRAIDVMAIDHLPSFLPKESSTDFSGQLLPYLHQLLNDGSESLTWKNAADFYYQHAA